MKNTDFVVRFAGEGGQGVVTSADGFASANAQVGYHVQTFSTFPSQIRGGPVWTQTRISTEPIRSSGDDLDVLVAFNEYAYNEHKSEVREGGVIIFDSGTFELEGVENSFGMAFDDLARSTGNARAANMVVMGALAYLVEIDQSILEQFVTKRFTRGRPNDQEIIESNIKALTLGRIEAENSGFIIGQMADAIPPEGEQVLINGNVALSLGAMAAGIDVYVGYPISPATPILIFMENNLPGPGKFAYQSTSEIESITSIVGAAFAGKKAMTATAGPGFTLMGEGIGLAWMAEIPVVVVDVQRGGPSTGLPTDVEQSDLNIACYGGHGDSPRVVLAVSDVEDCFYTAIEAVNIARKYSVPVFVLSDQAIATRIEAFNEPDLKTICKDVELDLSPVPSHKPYDLSSGDGLSRHRAPGTRIEDGRYPVVTGLEHDESGHPSGDAVNHIAMTKKRRNKLKTLADELPVPEVYGADSGDVLLVGWGSTKGPLLEAVEELSNNGDALSALHIKHINPLPNGLDAIFSRFNSVYVVEMNDGGVYGYGQVAGVLRARFADARIKGINKTAARRWKVSEIIERVKARRAEETATA